jgi:hypothetical protein
MLFLLLNPISSLQFYEDAITDPSNHLQTTYFFNNLLFTTPKFNIKVAINRQICRPSNDIICNINLTLPTDFKNT